MSQIQVRRKLENVAMVEWAKHQNGLPANPERYIVENLYWNNGKWKKLEGTLTQRDSEDSIK